MSATAGAPRVAVITGASHGIGAGLAAGFRRAGYAVVGTARSMPPSGDDGYIAVEGDIAEAETAQRVVAQALDRFGRVDTLVNNAGICRSSATSRSRSPITHLMTTSRSPR